MRTSIALFALAMSSGSIAAAQDSNVERQKEMEACVALESDAARLACFDAVMSGNPEIDEEVRRAREQEMRENFGLPETAIRERKQEEDRGRFRRPPPEPDIVVNSTVTDVRREANGNYTFALANGQVWRTTSAGTLRHNFKRGDKLRLEEGMIAGIRARVEGRNGFVGVERLR